ncbi:MAG: hypothetical protein ACYTAS_02330 [Planctomycetota bacterium]
MPSLEDFGATVVIGACSIAGLALAIDWLWDKPWFSYLKRDAGENAPLGLMIVLLAASYAVGMLIENTSDYVIGVQTDELSLPQLLTWPVPSESDLKKNVLFQEGAHGAKMTRLGREVHEAGLFRKYAGADFRLCGEDRSIGLVTWGMARHLGGADTLKSVSMKVYYAAKNEVFREDNYFGELMDIQRRIDFARSFGLGAAYVFVAVVLGVLGRSAYAAVGTVCRILRPSKAGDDPGSPREDRTEKGLCDTIRRVLAFSAVVCFFYYVALSIYEYEETQFNKRVFGYFISMTTGTGHGLAQATPAKAKAEVLEFVAHRSLEASGVAVSDDRFLIVNDKDNQLYVVEPSAAGRPISTTHVNGFPEEKAKFEDICFHPESGYFYVTGAHYTSVPNYQKVFRFKYVKDRGFWTASPAEELIGSEAILAHLSPTSSVEGMTVVGAADSPRVLVGIRSKAKGRFDILEFRLEGRTFAFVGSHEVPFSPALSSGGIPYHLSGLAANADGTLLVLAASEDADNKFSGNRVYSVDMGQWTQCSVTFEFASSQKAEGLAIRHPAEGERSLVVVFDNDYAKTGEPSRIMLVPSLDAL